MQKIGTSSIAISSDIHELGRIIRSDRLRQGMTLVECASLIDRNVSTLKRIESGEGLPFISTLFAISDTLNIPSETLFN